MKFDANFWTILEAIATALSVVVMMCMTCYFHKINHELSKKERYLRYIIELYYKIMDASKLLFSEKKDVLTEVTQNIHYQEIRVNCSLMIYYLTMYPGFYGNRTRFKFLLNDIIAHPEGKHNYDLLAIALGDFCQNIRKDSKDEGMHIFINGREDGYPEKDT